MAEGGDEEANPSNEKPFFAIDEDKSTGSSSPPPTSLFMGSLDASVSTPSSPPPSQLTGDVSVLSGAQTFTVPHVDPKQGMQWGQYFLGLFLPFGIVIAMIFILGVVESQTDYDNYWRYEIIDVTSEDNSTFEFSIEPREDEFLDRVYNYGDDAYDQEFYVSIEAYPELTSKTDVYQYDDSNGRINIGYFDPSNGTVFFQLDNYSAESMAFEIEYIDQDYYYTGYDGQASEIIETIFCMLPFIYIVAIIASFVKGKKSLAYGLLTALPASIVIGPALFFILLIIAFGGL
ncbi:MAG: hypothetical protein L7S48_01645 [Candidatus Poseidonia sp.]|nr:hypothetical protein [Poseidonia sp.]